MYLFLFTAIPLYYFLFHEIEKRRYLIKGFGYNFFCGSVTSVFYCFIGFLVATPYRLPEFNFSSNFIYFLLYGTVFPVLCCLILFFLLGKNSWSFKTLMLSDVIPSFYTVFIPFRVISSYEIHDHFTLFILPSLFICCFFLTRKVFSYIILEKAVLWKKILFGIFTSLVCLIVPAIAETLYFIAAPLWLRCVVEIGLFLFAVASVFLFRGDVSCAAERIENIMTLRIVQPEKKQKKTKVEKVKDKKVEPSSDPSVLEDVENPEPEVHEKKIDEKPAPDEPSRNETLVKESSPEKKIAAAARSGSENSTRKKGKKNTKKKR
ncbi:MAG: hypothetical protein K5930_03405 [Treponemataceae bacterium]|nr:hypothetical protein [Treponemataceae bacterium]